MVPAVGAECFDRLEPEFGPPLHVPIKGGTPKLNAGFLVCEFLMEHDVVFDGEYGRFYRYDPETGLWRHHAEAAIQHQFGVDARALVRDIEKANEGDGRLGMVMFSINHPLLRNLIDQLKGAALRESASLGRWIMA